jgi:hypothetical protein
MIKRHHNWNVKLAEFITERAHAPFIWGQNDCCWFANDAVLAMSGVDIAAKFRGKYDSKEAAYKIVKDYAKGGVVEFADKLLREHGVKEVELNFATGGDVVLVDGDYGDTLGIVELNGREVLATGLNGLMRLPRAQWKKAWRI